MAAYPYFAGSPGLAPDHTIVVTGVGQADLASNSSDQAAAQRIALAAALADAKTQADTIAADTGLTISGVLSVSASMSPGYGVIPMVTNGAATPPCVVAHATLDRAVLASYGWPADLPDDEIVARLLALNLEREPAPSKGTP
jgi:hypothetical protein